MLLTVFQNRRQDDDFRTLRAVLDGGALGPLVRFESRYDRYRPAVQQDRWREDADPAVGGGLLLDLGAHLVDQAVTLFGAPAAVYAEVDRVRPGAGRGRRLRRAAPSRRPTGAPLGDHDRPHARAPLPASPASAARSRCTAWTRRRTALKAGARPGDPGWGVSARTGTLVADLGGVAVTADVELLPGAYERFYARVRDAVRSGAPPPVDPEDAVLGLRILEAARLSAAQGGVVPLGRRSWHERTTRPWSSSPPRRPSSSCRG